MFQLDAYTQGLEVYRVGGAVRDELLGWPVVDHDWVVVGATPEMMQQRGFKPVGRDFPVFLHPATQEEYALARTERKSGHGYGGFEVHASPDVTLEEDLSRRDLTINAIAQRENGELIDPFHGERDLQARLQLPDKLQDALAERQRREEALADAGAAAVTAAANAPAPRLERKIRRSMRAR